MKSEKLDLPVVKKSVRVLAIPVNALLVTVCTWEYTLVALSSKSASLFRAGQPVTA